MTTFESPLPLNMDVLIIDDQESMNANCFMERGNARKCSLDHIIVQSSPSLVQELYQDDELIYQDDELILQTPQQFLGNAFQDNENAAHETKSFKISGLLPRNSRSFEYESQRVNLGGNIFHSNDEIFRSSKMD
eukprot:CAMPEP_0194198824 /NCGR_PEP_ID=MMETSP0156-20130528/61_1 /TAXON_ID=33649 /ORGANISM="Thalassionema nitzschioides, Strain L26-B" /LENGTH=133 /DNA_ID=CAMNT_0038923649 /DNA_START=48 /DNA_END=446 /DNA_ORIENTATION=-